MGAARAPAAAVVAVVLGVLAVLLLVTWAASIGPGAVLDRRRPRGRTGSPPTPTPSPTPRAARPATAVRAAARPDRRAGAARGARRCSRCVGDAARGRPWSRGAARPRPRPRRPSRSAGAAGGAAPRAAGGRRSTCSSAAPACAEAIAAGRRQASARLLLEGTPAQRDRRVLAPVRAAGRRGRAGPARRGRPRRSSRCGSLDLVDADPGAVLAARRALPRGPVLRAPAGRGATGPRRSPALDAIHAGPAGAGPAAPGRARVMPRRLGAARRRRAGGARTPSSQVRPHRGSTSPRTPLRLALLVACCVAPCPAWCATRWTTAPARRTGRPPAPRSIVPAGGGRPAGGVRPAGRGPPDRADPDPALRDRLAALADQRWGSATARPRPTPGAARAARRPAAGRPGRAAAPAEPRPRSTTT